MFRTRVQGLARAAGLAARFFASPEDLLAALAGANPPPDLVLLDLSDPRARGLLALEGLAERARAAGEGGRERPPVLAFYSHVESETRRRALDLGADRVVPRSRFVAEFEPLVRALIAHAG